jgi:L-fuconolactonase
MAGTPMIFDCHAHIVSDNLDRYPTNPLGGTIREGDLDEPITAERLLRMLDDNEVERAVVVQRAYIYGFDNSYVVDAAAAYPDRLRAVCMIDALDDDAPAQVRHWVAGRGAIGIRMSEPYRGADASWFSSPRAMAVWETAAALGIPVRLHLFRWNRLVCLPAIADLAARFPQLTIVVDHLSNLAAEEGPPSFGLDEPLRALIALDNVFLLFSTINLAKLVVEDRPAAPVIEHLTAAFGAHRLLWGSDIGQSKASYEQMRAMADAAVAGLSGDERRQLLYDTGKAVYGWA